MQRHADEPQWAPLRDQDISLRGAYRTRPVDELEECTWAAEDDPKALVTEHVRLASVSSQQPTRIVWTNTSQFAVRILWVDFEGNEIAYSILEPGKSKRYRTFTTHAWICREVESGVRMLCNGRTACIGRDGEQKVSVTAPPQLIWTTETHTLFPTECQQRTRALLLAHNCLEKAVTYSSGRSAACPPSPARAPPASPRRLPMLKVSSGAADASPMTPRTMVAVCPASPRAAPLTPRRLPAVAEPEGMPSFTEPKAAPLPAAIDFNGPIDGDSMTRGCGSAGAGPSCVAPRMMVCTAPPAAVPAGARSNGGIIRSLLHAVKHSLFCSCNSEPATPLAPGDMAAFLPAVPESAPLAAGAALTRTVSAAAAFVTAANAAAEPAASWPPRGAHLGLLPYGIVMRIVELANTEQYFVRQSLYMPALGRADISPALLDGPPPAPAPAGEEQAGGVQAQQ